MGLRKYNQYHVDFDSKWTGACGALMGLSFFLRIVYYFALMNLKDVPLVEMLTSMILGILLCGGFVVCLICFRLNAPGLFGILGVAQCAILILATFATGNVLRIVLAILWYALCAAVFIVTINGNLPGRLLAGGVFWLGAFVRIVFFDLGRIGLFRWVQELAVLSVLIALGCFAMGLKSVNNEKRNACE